MQTIYIILTFFLLSIVSLTYGIYLNKTQQSQIINLIKNNELTFFQREKINTILFEAYKNCAHRRASIFKYIHKYKCRNIDIKDLKLASEFGLMKAAHNYNGNSSFYYYSSLHIKNELLNSLTNHNSIASLPKTTLRNGFSAKKQNFDLQHYYFLQNKLNVIYESIKTPQFLNVISNTNSNKVLDIIIQTEEDEELWDNILSLIVNPLMKKIFLLKYDKYFNKIRTDKEISEITGYSKGHININLRKIKAILREHSQEIMNKNFL